MGATDGSHGATAWPPVPLPAPNITAGDLEMRIWHPNDAAQLRAAWNDEEISRWTKPPGGGEDRASRWITGESDRRALGAALDLVITRQGEVIGEIGLSQFDARPFTAAVGYWVGSGARGEGVAGRAVTATLEWAAASLGLRMALAQTDSANVASIKTLEHAGFTVLAETGSGLVVYAWRH